MIYNTVVDNKIDKDQTSVWDKVELNHGDKYKIMMYVIYCSCQLMLEINNLMKIN